MIMIAFFAMQGMGDFLSEMAVMMSQNKSTVSLLSFVIFSLSDLVYSLDSFA